MKKYLLIVIVWLSLIPVSAFSQNKTVSIALFDFYPFLLKSLPEKGYAYELANAALKESGYTVTAKFVPLIRAITETTGLQFDVILGLNPSHTPELAFSKTPITSLRFMIWARTDMNWHYDSIDSIKTVNLLTVKGFDYTSSDKEYQDYINTEPSNVRFLFGENAIQTAFKLIDNKRGDIFALDIDQAAAILSGLNMVDKFKSVGELKHLYFGYFGVSQKHPRKNELLDAYEKGMAKIKKSGELNQIIQKYVKQFNLQHIPLK